MKPGSESLIFEIAPPAYVSAYIPKKMPCDFLFCFSKQIKSSENQQIHISDSGDHYTNVLASLKVKLYTH